MRRWIPFFLLLIVILNCSEKKPEDFTEDKALYDEATNLLKNEEYSQAITFFESLKNRFPQSPLAAESELKIADAHFEKEEFIEAEVMYRNFRTLHPTHEKVPYAYFRTGLSQYKRKPRSIDQDQSDGQAALATFNEFIKFYPNDPHVTEAKKYSDQCNRALTERE